MGDRRILNSWKEIANYLGRGVRTVQRWESQLGLPVHRPAGKDHSAVLAFSSELDRWLDSLPVRQTTASQMESSSDTEKQAADLRALLSRAESMLQKLDSILVRSEEMHSKLSAHLEILADDKVRGDLRATPRPRSIEAGAA